MSCLLLCTNIVIFLPATNPDTTKPIVDTLHYSMETVEWEAFPVHTVRDILILQPGVVDCGGDLHIRGGFAENIEYWLDGVPLFITNLPLESVRKVYITKNPTSARYGRPNVVEIEAKEREKFGRWSTGFDEGMNTYELNISGTLYDKMKYSLMGYTKSRDYERSYLFDLSNTDMDLYYLVGRMSYDVSPSTNIGIGLINVRGQGGLYTTFRGLLWAGAERGDNGEKYNPDWLRSSWLEKGKQFYAYFQHRINEKMSFSVRYVNFEQHKIIGERDLEFDEKRRFYEDIKFEPWWMYVYDPPLSGWDERDENGEYIYPHGAPMVFRFGSPGFWHKMERNMNLVNANFEAKITDWSKINAGLEFKRNTIGREVADQIYCISTVDSVTPEGDTIRVVHPELRYIENSLWGVHYQKAPISNKFWLDFTARKAGMTLSSGLRVDYYNPRTWIHQDSYPPDSVLVESTWEISPKLYLTYTPTAKIKIGMGYNQFYMNEPYITSYPSRGPYGYPSGAVNFSRFGYTQRENAIYFLSQAKLFEVQGLCYLTENVILSLTAFRKEIFKKDVYGFSNEDNGTTDGIETALRYNSLSGLRLYFAYTLQNSRYLPSYYFYPGPYDYIPAREPVSYKHEEVPSSWDRRHGIIALLSWEIRKGWSLEKINPFENIIISTIFRAGSGLPYTRRNKNGDISGEINAERMGWNYVTDLKVTKGIKVSGLNLSVFLEVTNLFNIKNVLNVYPYTGKPDDNGLIVDREYYLDCTFPSYCEDEGKVPVGALIDGSADERRDLDGDGFITTDEWYKSYVNAYTDYMKDPFNYGPPRKIGIGVQLEW